MDQNKQPADKKTAKKRHKILKNRQLNWIYLIIYDILAVSYSFLFALLIRYDLNYSAIPVQYLETWQRFAPIYAVFCISVFAVLRLYNSIWRFASFTEVTRVTIAALITAVFHITIITIFFERMPVSYYILGICFQSMLIGGIRFSYRIVLLMRSAGKDRGKKRVMVIGGGEAGLQIIREIRRNASLKEKVICIIDDNSNKLNRDIEGIRVIGGRDMIAETVKSAGIDKIYITIPSMSNRDRKEIVEICKETGCELKILPGLYQLALGNVSVSSLRDVEVEDLLGREPVEINPLPVQMFLRDKTVLITGGGGSIGSELCRQVAASEGLKKLIILDIYENNAHAIRLELEDKYPDLDLLVLIGSVRNSRRIKKIFRDHRPDVVFHAAAHKHVPLMEDSPCEAIKNNVFGTYYTAYAAMAYGCEHFVLVSTDKAVNPVNIMGASKRLCEMIVQTFARKIEQGRAYEMPDLHGHTGGDRVSLDTPEIPDRPVTQFAAVRFGNVLGSNGSVIPRFREQIARGGPVTVTHPEIIRYFMTIPEAASLVLEAAAFGGGGRIYVLDMGTPVKIDDLARNMIKLSGLKPDEDIKIVYTGLRPGEKLYEERLMDEEGLTKTANDLINIGQPIAFDEDEFLKQLPGLFEAAYEDREDIREILEGIVPTYHPAGEHGTEAKSEAYRHQRMEMLIKDSAAQNG